MRHFPPSTLRSTANLYVQLYKSLLSSYIAIGGSVLQPLLGTHLVRLRQRESLASPMLEIFIDDGLATVSGPLHESPLGKLPIIEALSLAS